MEEDLLAKYGIKVIKGAVVKSAEEAVAAAKKLGYPVAMKIISPEILHKSERGCVKINLRNEREVRDAYAEIMRSAGSAKFEGMLVQKMGRKGIELIIGGKKDAQFGQLILFGVGGIYVEVYKDFSMRVCPIEENDAVEMIKEIKAYPILAGARGRRPVNEKKIAKLLLKVSEFLEKEDPKEFDLNPVIADEKGYDIVDVRLIK